MTSRWEPLINAAARDTVAGKVASAVAQGRGWRWAVGAAGGQRRFDPPTLLLDVRQEMDIIHERPSVRCCRWWPFLTPR
ncbi:hypothetical protein LNQ52_26465 [Klebsiella pneumoniae subsp. pneumoniae]|nr:hypothetical protein [Klebsiella pneumoniae subsp. pneumoniae]